MADPTHCVVITTTDSEANADRLAHGVVEARVGACAQVVGPIRSTYRWQGSVQIDQEWQVWIKTTMAALDALTEFLRANHNYDLPEVLALPVLGGNPDYLRWITEETDAPPGS